MRGVAGVEQVHARVGGDGPVVVLAAAVDAGKGLFVQQTDQSVAVQATFCMISMVSWLWSVATLVVVKIGRQLVLRGRDLVVLGFGEDAELPELVVQVLHIGLPPGA